MRVDIRTNREIGVNWIESCSKTKILMPGDKSCSSEASHYTSKSRVIISFTNGCQIESANKYARIEAEDK